MHVRKGGRRNACGPFIRIALAVNVEVWAWDLLSIGVTVWGAGHVDSRKNDNFPRTCLILRTQKVNTAPGNVEEKRLSSASRNQRNLNPASHSRIRPVALIDPMLFHREQRVGLRLGQIEVWHHALKVIVYRRRIALESTCSHIWKKKGQNRGQSHFPYAHIFQDGNMGHMKTTVEIADSLFEEAKGFAASRGVPLRQLVEEGLRAAISQERGPRKFRLRNGSVGGKGLRDPLSWPAVRGRIYEGRGE